MPWDIYLDWLQDQGNEDLRLIDLPIITSGITTYWSYGLNDGCGLTAGDNGRQASSDRGNGDGSNTGDGDYAGTYSSGQGQNTGDGTNNMIFNL